MYKIHSKLVFFKKILKKLTKKKNVHAVQVNCTVHINSASLCTIHVNCTVH